MGNYSLDVLIRKWTLEELTAEQAIGQLILMLQKLARRIEKLEEKNADNRRNQARAS